jgi:nucleoside-diphosphate-sugar epimerase
MKVLITGWSGFIGRALRARLLEMHGAESLIYLARPAANADEANLIAGFQAAGSTVITADLREPVVSERPLPPVDLVYHLAANIDTEAPASEMRLNDEGTVHLLEWAGEALRGARVVYTSSVAVQDRSGPAAGPLNETSPCTPRTPYGVSKLRGEEILKESAAALGFSYTIVRLPTVYGPGQKVGGMFDLLAQSAARAALTARVNWPGRTSVMFIQDVVEALVSLGSRAEAANQLYCLSSGEDISVGELAAAIGEAIGRPVRPVKLPRPVWGLLRRLVWLPPVPHLVPARAAVSFWRLTLIVDDGFWFDSRKFLAACPMRITPLTDGLRTTFTAPRPQSAVPPDMAPSE